MFQQERTPMRRRTFLSTSAAIAGASALTPVHQLWGGTLNSIRSNLRNGIGLQLWTVRNQMAEDIEQTLQEVKEAGYEQVELMNVMDSAEIVAKAKDIGLEVKSAFFNWESICNPENATSIDSIIERATEYGLEHLVFGYVGRGFRETADQIKTLCERGNAAAEKAKAAGMQMCYHNHSFEFTKVDGEKTAYDLMIEHFDDSMKFEVDVFWVAIGGADPYETIESLGERVSQIHLKDLLAETEVCLDEGQVPHDAFQELGDGTIDMQRVLKLADAAGVQQFHVEQDQSPDPIASIRQSRDFLSEVW